MNQNPHDHDENEPEVHTAEISIQNIPLAVAVIAGINTMQFLNALVNVVEILVVLYLAYEIIGRTLFIGLIVTPLLVAFIYYAFSAKDDIDSALFIDDDGDDDDGDDDNSHFNDNFNKRL